MAILSFFVYNCQVFAHDYYTVIYKDGRLSQRFYTEYVDSMVCSKITVDSVFLSSWCVQEIWTPDSVYRIPLNQIERIELTAVDMQKVANDVNTVIKSVEPLFKLCSSVSDADNLIPEILKIEEVENAWTDNMTLFVQVQNWGSICYLFPPKPMDDANDEAAALARILYSFTPKDPGDHIYTKEKKVCLINQVFNDEEYKCVRDVVDDLYMKFKSCGFDITIENKPTIDFFENVFFDQDIIGLITHGSYNERENTHWHLTGETIPFDSDGLPTNDYFSLLNIYPPNMLTVGAVNETRNGKKETVYYWKISDHFLASVNGEFRHPGEAIVFDVACHAMKGNYSMANVLKKKGAGAYLAYNNENCIGHNALRVFYTNMLNGMSSFNASLSIPRQYRVDEKYNGHLVYSYKGKKGLNLCFTKTNTLHPEMNKFMRYSLCGSIDKILKPDDSLCKFGFKVSMKPNMENGEYFDIGQYSASNHENFSFKSETHELKFCYDLKREEYYEGKPIYYQAYTKDYDAYYKKYIDYCYGDVIKVNPVEKNDALLETEEATDVTKDSATLNGIFYVSDELRELYQEAFKETEIGFLYGTEDEKKVNEMHWVPVGKVCELENGTLTASVSGLKPNQTYHYFITSHNQEGYDYNDKECSFTTKCDCFSFCNVSFIDEGNPDQNLGAYVSVSYAQLNSIVGDCFCEKHYKKCGFYVNTTGSPNANNAQFIEAGRAGIGEKHDHFSYVNKSELKNLRKATRYYFRPVCFIDEKEYLGEECSFLTPDVETLEAIPHEPIGHSYQVTIYAKNIHELGNNEKYRYGYSDGQSTFLGGVWYTYDIGLEWYWMDDETHQKVSVGNSRDFSINDAPDIFDWPAHTEEYIYIGNDYHYVSARKMTLYYRAYIKNQYSDKIYGKQKSLTLYPFEQDLFSK